MRPIVIIAVIVGINSTILQATSEATIQPRVVINLEHDNEKTDQKYPLWLEKTLLGTGLVVGGYLAWRFVIKNIDIFAGRWKMARVERQSLAKRQTRVDLRGATFPLFKVQRQGSDTTHYLLATSSDLGISIDDLPDDSSIYDIVQKVDKFVTSRVDNPWFGQIWHDYLAGRAHRKFTLERIKPLTLEEAMQRDKIAMLDEMVVINNAKSKKHDELTKTLEELEIKLTKLSIEERVSIEDKENANKIKNVAEKAIELAENSLRELTQEKPQKLIEKNSMRLGKLEKLLEVLDGVKNEPAELLEKTRVAREEGNRLFEYLANGPFSNLDKKSVSKIQPRDIVDYLRWDAFEEIYNFEQSTVLMEEQLTRLGRKMGKEIVELSPPKELWEANRIAIEEKNIREKSKAIVTLIERDQDLLGYVAGQLLDAQRAYLDGNIDKTIKHLNLELDIKRSLAQHEQINLSWLGRKSEFLFNELRRTDIAINGNEDKIGLGAEKPDQRRVQSLFRKNVLLFLKKNPAEYFADNPTKYLDEIFDQSFLAEADNSNLVNNTLKEISYATKDQTIFNKKTALLEQLVQRADNPNQLIKDRILSKSLRDISTIDIVVKEIRNGNYWQRLNRIIEDADRRWENHHRSVLIDCLNDQRSCFVYLDIAHFSFKNLENTKYTKNADNAERKGRDHWYDARKHSLLELLRQEGFEITPIK